MTYTCRYCSRKTRRARYVRRMRAQERLVAADPGARSSHPGD